MNGELPQKKLPHARLNALAGLLEKLSLDDGRADLQHLGRALHFELVDLLPLVEAGELLGFIIPEDGALVLTQLVRTYADASILARKELLAGRVLRLPLINWIYDTLQRDDTQSRKSHLAKQYDAADKLDDLILLAGMAQNRAISAKTYTRKAPIPTTRGLANPHEQASIESIEPDPAFAQSAVLRPTSKSFGELWEARL